jgi:hypothetical protein
MLFGGSLPADGLVRGRYFVIRPDGSTGAILGSFEVRGDRMTMFPAGGDQIDVLLNDAPQGGVLATDYAHYATPPNKPLAVTPRPGSSVPVIGPEREQTPQASMSRSSGKLNFSLGGATLEAVMQQQYVTVANAPPAGTFTINQPLPPMRIRFLPQ